jgi:hypothetical protein
MKTKHQKFEYRELRRSQVKDAPYNPNVMTPDAYRKLKKKIADVGLVETPIWNETTGNIVAGHHRLAALDELEGNQDYTIGVSVVRLPLKREMEMNVFLNNAQAQGTFDRELFLKLLEEDDPINLEDAGLTRLELEIQFGDLPDSIFPEAKPGKSRKQIDAPAAPAAVPPAETAASEPRGGGPAVEKADDEQAEGRYYVMLTFGNVEEKGAWLTERSFPLTTQFLDAAKLGIE